MAYKRLRKNRRSRILRDAGIKPLPYTYTFTDDVQNQSIQLTPGLVLSFDVVVQKTIGAPNPVSTPIALTIPNQSEILSLQLYALLGNVADIAVSGGITIEATPVNSEVLFDNLLVS